MRFISINEFRSRVAKLPANGRFKLDPIGEDTVVFHRIPEECYESSNRFYESKLQDVIFSIPDQSITLQLDHIDEIDALIEFNECTDTYAPKLNHGVVWWTKSQLSEILVSRKEDCSKKDMSCLTTCWIDVVHTPYRLNYYHGDISTVVDFSQSAKPSKTIRKLIRNAVLDIIYKNSQFCVDPKDVCFDPQLL